MNVEFPFRGVQQLLGNLYVLSAIAKFVLCHSSAGLVRQLPIDRITFLLKFRAPLVEAGVFIEKREKQCAYVKKSARTFPFVFPKAGDTARDKRGAGVLSVAADLGPVGVRLPHITLVIELQRKNQPETAFARTAPTSRKLTEVKSQEKTRNQPSFANGWPENLVHEFGRGSMDVKPCFGWKLLHFHIGQRARDKYP